MSEEKTTIENIVCDNCGGNLFSMLYELRKQIKDEEVYVGIKNSTKTQCQGCGELLDISELQNVLLR